MPTGAGVLLSSCYWQITPFGTPGTFSANLTFTIPSWFTDAAAGTYTLYHREGNSDGSWTATVSGAANITSTTITFNGVTSFSQFTIGSSDNALPVELASFTATAERNSVQLQWKTATEVNCYGFEVKRSAISSQLSANASADSRTLIAGQRLDL